MYYIFRACVFSLRYPAHNGLPLYCHLWPVLLNNIFQHYVMNSTIFGEKVIEHKKCVLIFFITLSEYFSF